MSTLIVYASKHGSVEQCTSMLKGKLEGKVEVHNLKQGTAPSLESYDRVIVGGSIYAGRIQKEVTAFCAQNLMQLKSKKTGLFICCMNKENAAMQLNNVYPKELAESAAAKDSFGGTMRFSDMNFFERLITKMVSKAEAKKGGSQTPFDGKTDITELEEDRIKTFADRMNQEV